MGLSSNNLCECIMGRETGREQAEEKPGKKTEGVVG